MKNLFFYFALLMISMCPLLLGADQHGKKIKLDPSIPLPPYSEILKKTSSNAAQLKALLDEGNLREFYQQANSLFEAMNPVKDEDFTIDSLSDRLWIYYYYTSAPTLPTDNDDDLDWLDNHNNIDLRVKSSLGDFIGRHKPERLAKQLPFRKQELADLLASYYAGIMNTLYSSYDPWWKEKENTIRKESHSKTMTNDEEISRNNSLNSLNSRNRAAGMSLRFHEKWFVKFLMDGFPHKASTIKKYITKAGYGDDEFEELIELTAGRNAQTLFLLKGTRSRSKPQKNKNKPQDIPRTIAL